MPGLEPGIWFRLKQIARSSPAMTPFRDQAATWKPAWMASFFKFS
jgi:hypothetical protein